MPHRSVATSPHRAFRREIAHGALQIVAHQVEMRFEHGRRGPVDSSAVVRRMDGDFRRRKLENQPAMAGIDSS